MEEEEQTMAGQRQLVLKGRTRRGLEEDEEKSYNILVAISPSGVEAAAGVKAFNGVAIFCGDEIKSL